MHHVILISYPEDEHGSSVEAELERRGADVLRLSFDTLAAKTFRWELGQGLGEASDTFGAPMKGMWRRPGKPSLGHIDPRYGDFAASETRDAFRGSLLSLGVNWLNDAAAMWLAEHKIVQLETARRIGLLVPPSLVTNDPVQAERFILETGAVVAKAVRYGLVASYPDPLMAWTRRVAVGQRMDLEGIPVLLQAEVEAEQHVRVVTVGQRVFASYIRSGELDWRADQRPQQWRAFDQGDPLDKLADQARRLSSALGLGFTSQDWIVDAEGRAHFIEANPNGQWLFLDEGHDGAITGAIAGWLLGEAEEP